MENEGLYEVRVKVKTLTDASKVITLLDESGFKEVEMGPPRLPMHPSRMDAASMRGRFKEAILKALKELDATTKERAVSAEEIIAQIRKSPEFTRLTGFTPFGILNRTVNMIASAALADRHGLISYDEKEFPRRFWLTEKGVQKVKGNKNREGEGKI